jgi:hypothetical protein
MGSCTRSLRVAISVFCNNQEMVMAKETKKEAAEVRPPPSDGGMSTGVAIIGFLLCFLAGGAVMWGWDSHRLKAGGISAEMSSRAGHGARGRAGCAASLCPG